MRGELLFVQPAPPTLDPVDGTAIPRLSDFAEGDEPISRDPVAGGGGEAPVPVVEYSVVVVDDRGRPRPDARVVLHARHGSRPIELDAAGAFAEQTDAAHLPTQIELVERLGPPSDPAAEGESTGTRVALPNRAGAQTNLGGARSHLVVIQRPSVDVFEMEDLAFVFDGRIFRAGGLASDEESDAATGLDVFRVVFQFAAAHPDASVLVAGHTDSVGASDFNHALSELRAKSVLLYLTGEREAWADHCVAQHKQADFDAAVTFLAAFKDELPARPDKEGWLQIYDGYDEALAASLQTDAAGLAQRRADLKLLESGLLGCGEHWPEEAVGRDGFKCQSNRRVEILFLDERDVEPGVTQLQPPGTGIYDGSLTARYVSPRAEDHLVALILRLRIHDDTRLEHAHCFRLHSTDGAIERELHLPDDPDDEVELRFDGLDPARRYTLHAYSEVHELPHVVFEDLPFHGVRHIEPEPEPEAPEQDADDFPQET